MVFSWFPTCTTCKLELFSFLTEARLHLTNHFAASEIRVRYLCETVAAADRLVSEIPGSTPGQHVRPHPGSQSLQWLPVPNAHLDSPLGAQAGGSSTREKGDCRLAIGFLDFSDQIFTVSILIKYRFFCQRTSSVKTATKKVFFTYKPDFLFYDFGLHCPVCTCCVVCIVHWLFLCILFEILRDIFQPMLVCSGLFYNTPTI